MKRTFQVFGRGIIQENPIFVILLGLCPTLAVTTAAFNGLSMGLATTFVLVCSNGLISALRKVIPEKVRIPSYIVIIASFVTVVDYAMAAYTPEMHDALGIFIPLIVVNCLILGRAEAFASENPPVLSVADGFGMGFGFMGSLTVIGMIREIIGTGKVFGISVMGDLYQAPLIAILPPGAFLTIGLLLAVFNGIGDRRSKAAVDKMMEKETPKAYEVADSPLAGEAGPEGGIR